MTEYILEPNEITEFKVHNGEDIKFIVKNGSVIFETIYLGRVEFVEKSSNETYQIKEKVKYRLHNTCNSCCNFVIIVDA